MKNIKEIMATHLISFLKMGYYAYSRHDKQKLVSTLSLQRGKLKTQIL